VNYEYNFALYLRDLPPAAPSGAKRQRKRGLPSQPRLRKSPLWFVNGDNLLYANLSSTDWNVDLKLILSFAFYFGFGLNPVPYSIVFRFFLNLHSEKKLLSILV